MHILLPLLLLSITVAASAQVRFLDAPLQEAIAQAQRENKLVFAHFTATWCMPCQWMESHTYQNEDLATFLHRHYLPVKVDVDDFDGYADKERYKVIMLPSILIFNARGEMLARYEESLSATRTYEILEKHQQSTMQGTNGALGYQAPKPRVDGVFGTSAPQALKPVDPANYRPAANGKNILYPPPTTTMSGPRQSVSAQNPDDTGQKLEPLVPGQWFGVQIGIFNRYEDVVKRVKNLEQVIEEEVRILSKNQGDQLFYRILVGKFSSRKKAEACLQGLIQKNIPGYVKDLAE